MTTSIRCPQPACQRLLGVRLDDGRVEVKKGRYVTRVATGEIVCAACGSSVEVEQVGRETVFGALWRAG